VIAELKRTGSARATPIIELETALIAARTLPAEELPKLLGALEEVRCTALARLSAPTQRRNPDELIDVEQAAERLCMSRDYIYRHHNRFPFTRRIGRKLLFSSIGLDEYLHRRK
jgi:excisionase family DNA binding protein